MPVVRVMVVVRSHGTLVSCVINQLLDEVRLGLMNYILLSDFNGFVRELDCGMFFNQLNVRCSNFQEDRMEAETARKHKIGLDLCNSNSNKEGRVNRS